MVYQNAVLVVVTIVMIMANSSASSRELGRGMKLEESNGSTATTDCWGALSELRSCSNEIIGFFLNGQTDIDTPCCLAIKIITNNCWPSMLTILGISAEEGHILAGYCDNITFSSPPASPPPLS